MPHDLHKARLPNLTQLVFAPSSDGQIHPLQGYTLEDMAGLSNGAATKHKTSLGQIPNHPFKISGPVSHDFMNEHGVCYVSKRNTVRLPPDVVSQHLPQTHQNYVPLEQFNGKVVIGDEEHRHGNPYHTEPPFPHRHTLHPYLQGGPDDIPSTRTLSKPRHASRFESGVPFEFGVSYF
jgi:hypothetical protein